VFWLNVAFGCITLFTFEEKEILKTKGNVLLNYNKMPNSLGNICFVISLFYMFKFLNRVALYNLSTFMQIKVFIGF
jgi:hypothetical protein